MNESMPQEPTFAQQQLTRIEAIIAESAGLQSVTIGNTSTSYVDLLAQRDYWRREVARESGQNPRVKRIQMGGF